MTPPQGAKPPKISASAEAKARKLREGLIQQEAASLQKQAELGAKFAAAVAERLGLKEGSAEMPAELAALAKDRLNAEAPPSAEWLPLEKGAQG